MTRALLATSLLALIGEGSGQARSLPDTLAGYQLGSLAAPCGPRRADCTRFVGDQEGFWDLSFGFVASNKRIWYLAAHYSPQVTQQTSYEELLRSRENRFGRGRPSSKAEECAPFDRDSPWTYRCAIWEESRIEMILFARALAHKMPNTPQIPKQLRAPAAPSEDGSEGAGDVSYGPETLGVALLDKSLAAQGQRERPANDSNSGQRRRADAAGLLDMESAPPGFAPGPPPAPPPPPPQPRLDTPAQKRPQ